MSNLPFWLPPDRDPPRSLPKLVVQGFDGPQAARQDMIDRLSGTIKQFYLKAARSHAAGIISQTAKTLETDGFKLTYQNVMGAETVTITVAASEAGEEQQKKETFPDYAVVDFVVQNHQDTTWLFTAALIVPDVGREQVNLPGPAGIVTRGVERDDFVDDYSDGVENGVWSPPPIIEIADPRSDTGSVALEKRITSLKVDFTKLPNRVTVMVDIYGHVDPLDDSGWEQGDFLGWTHQPDFTTDPPTTYGRQSVVPGELILEGGQPNPACLTAEYRWSTVSSTIAGAPDPPTICYYPELGDQEISSGGQNQSNVDASQWIYTAFAPSFVYTPPEGYVDVLSDELIYDHIHSVHYEWEVQIDGLFTPPEPWLSQGYDFWYHSEGRFYENDAYYTKRPVYDEVWVEREIPITSPVDLVYRFYEPGTRFFVNTVTGYDGWPESVIWTTEDGVTPERALFKTIDLSSEDSEGPVTVDNPEGYKHLGRLVLDRATRSVSWETA